MKPKILLSILALTGLGVLLIAFAIHRQNATAPLAAEAPRTFQVHGQIRDVDLANRTVRITHEEIPNYMPAMTMALPVKDISTLQGLASGDDVQFELSVTANDSWVSRISRIAPDTVRIRNDNDSTPSIPNVADSSTELQNGERVPDFELIDQDGKPVRLSDFRGRAVILTFIYTRCPLPNFCPLMSKNFQALQQRLEKEFHGRFQLISISIDPRFDRPQILKGYAARYTADTKSWTFATGNEEQISAVAGLFGQVHEPENGLISHNLRTALMGPDGRLRHVWKSNVWTPYEVDRMVGETLAEPKTISDRRGL